MREEARNKVLTGIDEVRSENVDPLNNAKQQNKLVALNSETDN